MLNNHHVMADEKISSKTSMNELLVGTDGAQR
jgi:hypothetical protein